VLGQCQLPSGRTLASSSQGLSPATVVGTGKIKWHKYNEDLVMGTKSWS